MKVTFINLHFNLFKIFILEDDETMLELMYIKYTIIYFLLEESP